MAGVTTLVVPRWAVTLKVVPAFSALIRKRGLLAIPVLTMVPLSTILALKAILNVPVNTVAALVMVRACWGASMLKRAVRRVVSTVSAAITGQIEQFAV